MGTIDENTLQMHGTIATLHSQQKEQQAAERLILETKQDQMEARLAAKQDWLGAKLDRL